MQEIRTVLIIDDDVASLQVLAEILQQHYIVKFAKSAKDGFELIEYEAPHLILLDVVMPNMTGYEMCEELKRDSNTAQIPIVFLTAQDELKDQLRGYGLGAIDYITKPFEPLIVEQKVKNYIKITEHYTQQQEIEILYKEFESVFTHSIDGIAITDLKSNFLNCNEAYLQMTGFSLEELQQTSCIELSLPQEKERLYELSQELYAKGYIRNLEKVCVVKGGRQIDVNMSLSIMPDQKRVLIIAKDITRIKLLESQAKLSSMGEMITNIAHHWRQPLSVINMSASALLMKAQFDQEVTKDDILDFTNSVVDQSKYLSKTIDDFSKLIKNNEHYMNVSIVKAINESIKKVKKSDNSMGVEFILETHSDNNIKGNLADLEQAFFSILENAQEILQERLQKEQKYIFVSTRKVDALMYEVKIFDNAGGISEDILAKVFEPYFTTKHQSLGTGLGLTITEKILREQYQAMLKVYNHSFEYQQNHYTGACFEITFYKDRVFK